MTFSSPIIALGAVLTFFTIPTVTQAKDLTIIMSPVMQQEQLQRDVSRSLTLVLDQVQPGERVLFIDGQALQIIADFNVPDKKAYAHPKAKLQANKTALAQLKRFSNNATSVPDDGVAGAIKLPQVLEFLGQNYPQSKDSDIIILGSPLYHDVTNTDWSMVGNKFADDDLFEANAAQSLFSTQGRAALLKGARIHWFTLDQSWESNSQYAYRIKRMWTLFIEGHGASLSTFSNDWATVTTRAASGAGALPHNFKPVARIPDPVPLHIVAKGLTEAELQAKEPNKRIEQETITSDTHLPIFERRVMASASSDVLNIPAKVEVGISWDCTACDLDLHVRPYKGAEVLSFSNKHPMKVSITRISPALPTRLMAMKPPASQRMSYQLKC